MFNLNVWSHGRMNECLKGWIKANVWTKVQTRKDKNTTSEELA